MALRTLKGHKQWSQLGRVLLGHAVIFPDLTNTDALVSPESPAAITGGRPNVQDVKLWLKGVENYWRGESHFQPLGQVGLRVAQEVFARPVEVRPLVSSLLADEEVTRVKLTEQQGMILSALGTRRRAAIAGGAGTGKTLLALQKARQLANRGLRTLLLCYNRPLADHHRNIIGENPQLVPLSFHQLCDWRVRQVRQRQGVDVLAQARTDYPREDYFDIQLPYSLMLAADALPEAFDAVIVDEGQDFQEEYWLPVEMHLKDEAEGYLYVFYDQNQALYTRASTFPIKDDPFALTTNCRNTRFIHDLAYQYYVGEETHPPDISGVDVEVLTAAGITRQAERIHNLVTELLHKERVEPKDIAVLVAGRPKQRYYELLSTMRLPSGVPWAVEVHQLRDSLVVDTVKRFKGLEASIVVLWGIDELEVQENRETFYVSFSRAKSRLYVVCEETTSSFQFGK